MYSPSITGNTVNVSNVFTSLLTGVNTIANELFFINATGTKLTVNNLFATNVTATGTTNVVNLIGTSATLTNLSSQNLTSNGNNLTIGTLSTNLVSFIINEAEVMRLKTTGDVSVTNSLAVGRDTPNFLLHVGSSTVPTGTVARFSNTDGNCNINPLSGINCTSDERLKKNINEVDFSALEKLSNVSVKSYNMLRQEEGAEKQIGFIAQNLENIMPWLVQTDEDGWKSVSYGNMTPVLVKAINELNSKVDAMNSKILNVSEIVVSNLKATFVEADKVKTKELCFADDLCFTESDMREFKTYLDSKKQTNTPPVPTEEVVVEETPVVENPITEEVVETPAQE